MLNSHRSSTTLISFLAKLKSEFVNFSIVIYDNDTAFTNWKSKLCFAIESLDMKLALREINHLQPPLGCHSLTGLAEQAIQTIKKSVRSMSYSEKITDYQHHLNRIINGYNKV